MTALAWPAPAAASAKPGYVKLPPSHLVDLFARGTHGYFISFADRNGRDSLSATRPDRGDGSSTATYEVATRQGAGDDLDVSLGPAGEVKMRFVPHETKKLAPQRGCIGRPTVYESGSFVGSFSFHGAGGLTSLHRHRIQGGVVRSPAETCHGAAFPEVSTFLRSQENTLRLVGGDPSGSTSFQATAIPAQFGRPAWTEYTAYSERTEDGVDIRDQVLVPAPQNSPFAVPDLAGTLPATTTVEPPAPFSGSASFEAPSRRTATLGGDLAVELPEVGEIPLAAPGTAAGLCHGYTCSDSVPKALRPRRWTEGLVLGTIEFQTIS